MLQAFPVKSISPGSKPLSAAFSQVHDPASLLPQAQAEPIGVWFSVAARSQVHSPAGRARHEQRGPVTMFSEDALSQVQFKADFWPQLQVALEAQTHWPSPRPQQERGIAILLT